MDAKTHGQVSMSNKPQNAPIKPITATDRLWREVWLSSFDWENCTFCGDKPTTHITSEGDFVCEECCQTYENYMRGISDTQHYGNDGDNEEPPQPASETRTRRNLGKR